MKIVIEKERTYSNSCENYELHELKKILIITIKV